MPGIFVTKGMQFGISKLQIAMTENGPVIPSPTFTLSYDVVPLWFKISFENLVKCKNHYNKRNEIWESENNDIKSEYLEKTFEYSMQSIISSAIALDAFYSKIKELGKIDLKTSGKASRGSYVCSIIQHSYKLKNHTVKSLKENLNKIYKLRDIAVHPSAKLKSVYEHPILKVGVEERFIQFDYESANGILFYCLDMIKKLKTEQIQKIAKITAYTIKLNNDLEEIVQQWKDQIINPILA